MFKHVNKNMAAFQRQEGEDFFSITTKCWSVETEKGKAETHRDSWEASLPEFPSLLACLNWAGATSCLWKELLLSASPDAGPLNVSCWRVAWLLEGMHQGAHSRKAFGWLTPALQWMLSGFSAPDYGSRQWSNTFLGHLWEVTSCSGGGCVQSHGQWYLLCMEEEL